MNLASRGLRDMDSGEQSIADEAELKRVRAQARKVIVQSVAIAAVATAVLLVLPW